MFKVGDRVVAWRKSNVLHGQKPGDVGVVVEGPSQYGPLVEGPETWNPRQLYFFNESLRLAEPATPATPAATPATPATPDTPTLRDQFAMAALEAMQLDDTRDRIAAACYAMADAMLAARSKTGGAK